ncbi:hypothetical protein GGF46_000701 [Coemansia sp. RSA 552]|nr:hypothetical protein GGF46_000701 [Coemansia sp. RSA 552]
MASGLVRWKSHVDKLLRYNHMTMTLSAEPFRIAESGARVLEQRRRESPREHHLAHQSACPTATLQYAFDSTLSFPEPFLTASPRFDSSFEPSLRHLPCVLFLHGNDPGGFDVARWVAGGLSHAHRLRNPLMPSRFGSYSVYNVQDGEDPQQSRFAVPMAPLGMLSISRPGYLESSPPHSPTFLAQATTVAQLIERLQLSTVHLVAHTSAAPVALEMASLAGFRRRIRSISLVDPQFTPRRGLRRLSERLHMLIPEWARTRAAYNALARSADDAIFLQAVADICGTEAAAEAKDDPAMARLYEGIGVFFSHWSSRKPGVLADSLMWSRLDRRSWGLVKAPILCITSTAAQGPRLDEEALKREEAARAALVSTRTNPEFAQLHGSGRMLFPLGRLSTLCLAFIQRQH